MNEKEAIERIKKLIKWFEKWDDDYTLVPCDKVYFETVLNLIEKQQAEIETLKRDFEIVDHECSRLEKEDIKKDMIINEMAEWIDRIDSTIFCDKEKCDDNCKECVIKHFNQKIEKGE